MRKELAWYLAVVVIMLIFAVLTPGCGKREEGVELPKPLPVPADERAGVIETVENDKAICIRIWKSKYTASDFQCYPKRS